MRSHAASGDALPRRDDRLPSLLLGQLRRDPALRNLRSYLPGAVLVGALLWGMCRHVALRLGEIPLLDAGRPEGLATALIVAWSWLAGYLLNAQLERRSSPLDLVLPLAPRRLWLGRMLAVALGGAAVVAATAGTIALGNWLGGIRPLLEPGLVSLALHLLTSHLLTIAVLQSPQPGLWRIPLRRGYVALIVASFLGSLVLVFALAALPRTWTLAPLAAALALGARVYRSLPASFALVPGAALPAAPPSKRIARTGSGRRPGGFWLLPATALRSSIDHFIWLYFPLLAFHGWILADRRESNYFPFFFFTWTVLAAWILITLGGLYRLDPLPISRRRLFAIFVLPALAALIAGYGFGELRPRPARIVLERCLDDYCVRIPVDFYAIAWDGEAPTLGSPWGESARALGAPPFRGGDLVVYHPYSISRHSSPDFVALQLSRAMAAVYGEKLSPEEVRDRHLELDDDGQVRLRGGGIELLTADSGLRSQGRLRTFLVALLLVVVPWLAFTAGVYRVSRGDGKGLAAKWTLPAVFFLMVAIGAGSLAAYGVGLVDLPPLSRLAGICVRQLGDALGTPGLTVLGALLLLGGYRLAEAQFLRLEALPRNPS